MRAHVRPAVPRRARTGHGRGVGGARPRGDDRRRRHRRRARRPRCRRPGGGGSSGPRHLAWAIASPVELPIEQMPARPWHDHHAAGDRADRRRVGGRARRHPPHAPPHAPPSCSSSGGPTPRRAATSTAPCAGWPAARSTSSPGASGRRGRGTTSSLSPDRIQLLRELVARYRHADEVYERVGVLGRAVAGPGRPVLRAVGHRQDAGRRDHRRRARASTCSSSTSRRSSASTSARPRRTSTRSSTPPRPATSCCSSTRPTRCSASARRSRTPATATPTSRCPTSCSASRPTTGWSRWPPTSSATSTTRSCAGSTCASSSRSPDEAERKAIWEHNLPARAPVAADVDVAFLARQFELSGGSIRNAALQAAFLAAAGDGVDRHGLPRRAASAASTRSSAAC